MSHYDVFDFNTFNRVFFESDSTFFLDGTVVNRVHEWSGLTLLSKSRNRFSLIRIPSFKEEKVLETLTVQNNFISGFKTLTLKLHTYENLT